MYERYCELRDQHKYKDSDVAKATNITKSTFSDWKNGKSKPNADKLLKIAKCLDVSVEYLMTGETEDNQPIVYIEPEVMELAKVLAKNDLLCELLNSQKDMPKDDLLVMTSMAHALNKDKGRKEQDK